MASSRTLPVDYNVSTYGSGKDYTSISTWESDTSINLVSAEKGEVLDCYAGNYQIALTISGATVNSSYFRVVRAADGEGHSGAYEDDGSVVRFYNTNASWIFNIVEQYSQIQDLVVHGTETDNTFFPCIELTSANTKGVGIICKASVTNLHQCRCYRVSGTHSLLVNSVGYNDLTSSIVCENYSGGANTDSLLYNCTLDNSGNQCIYCYDTGEAFIIKNTLRSSLSGDTGSITETTCADADSMSFVSPANGDYHLDSGDSGAIDQGTDLSSGDSYFNFDDDFNGFSRTGTWDIGADEYGSTASELYPITEDDISSASDITDSFISAIRELSDDDFSSLTDISDSVIDIIRGISIADFSSLSSIVDSELGVTRDIKLTNFSSLSEIEDSIVQIIRAISWGNISLSTNLSNAIVGAIRGLSSGGMSSLSQIGTVILDSYTQAMSVCWGHDTGVTEDTAENLSTWSGTAIISGSGDAEIITFSAGQESISPVWHLGTGDAEIILNKYQAGDSVSIQYKTGDTIASCNADSWHDFVDSFSSLGFVRIRLFIGA